MPERAVEEWLKSHSPGHFFVHFGQQGRSACSGCALMPDGKRKQLLGDIMQTFFDERLKTPVLAFGDREAVAYRRTRAHVRRRRGLTIGEFDAQIAAIARSHGFAVATRNVRDFEHCGVEIINPWEALGMTLSGKRILLIIGGGIAAYKSLDLIRRLRERGASVRAVMTAAAQEFVTPLSVGALTADHVFTDLFDRQDEHDVGHIRLAREADLIVVAPATADLMAKLANGLANDLASAVLLATDKQGADGAGDEPEDVERTRRRAATARRWRRTASPSSARTSGEMAESGEAGEGRMAEPLEIVAAIEALLADQAGAARRAGRSS